MRIAVIGSGISGLTAAYRLGPSHDVWLFEAGTYLGGHANTVEVHFDGERQQIDTGFIVFNDWTYPNFIALLKELRVPTQSTSMSFSVRCKRRNLEYCASSLNGLFAQRSNLLRPRYYRMLRDILRFNRSAEREIVETATRSAAELTVGEFLDRGHYSQEFAEQYLLPLGSAIWSCPRGSFRNFPMRFIVEFFRNHGLLNILDRPTWRVIAGGSKVYVEALARRLTATVRLATPIERVRRFPDRVELAARGIGTLAFDHVIFACHADQALALLADPSPVERELLLAFPYGNSTAILHTDRTLLPRRRRAWASWNYHLSADPSSGATLTYCMNILQNLRSRHVYNVSLNSHDLIDPACVLGTFAYEHPVFTTKLAAAQARHGELIDVNRSSYCGAYWGSGFHEDGVVSAQAVCQTIAATAEREAEQALSFA